ncbi:MAG: hypothetical protein BroJett022_03340 [Actinomycetes bacterium]|nr:MAG: hypothetical protein BroJett022_03340 [Actinomycetes bacterium]
MIIVDTSVLVDSLTGPRRSAAGWREAVEAGERMLMPALVLYEWLRGPRLPEELAAQDALLPAAAALPFGPVEAAAATELYRSASEPRGREVDIAIAAHAIVRDAPVWTLNVADFEDLAGVALHRP